MTLPTLRADQIARAADVSASGRDVTLSAPASPLVGGAGAPYDLDETAALTLTQLSATLSADLDAAGYRLTSVAEPVLASDAATKSYADTLAAGLLPKAAVRAATTAPIAATRSGDVLTADAPGALPDIDGVALLVGERLLVKDQAASHVDHGVYTVTDLGSVGSPYVLTRAADFDDQPDVEVRAGAFVFVIEGSQAGGLWGIVTPDPVIINTTAISFDQIGGGGGAAVTPGAGMVLTGSAFDVVAGDDSILVGPDSIAVQLVSTGALETLPGLGMRVKLQSTSGLVRQAPGLAVAFSDTSIWAQTFGIAVRRASQSGLEVVSGLRVALSGGSIKRSASGLLQAWRAAQPLDIESSAFTFDGVRSSYTLPAAPLLSVVEVIDLTTLLRDGSDVMNFVAAPTAGADQWSVTGSTLTIHGDVTLVPATYRLRYLVAS